MKCLDFQKDDWVKKNCAIQSLWLWGLGKPLDVGTNQQNLQYINVTMFKNTCKAAASATLMASWMSCTRFASNAIKFGSLASFNLHFELVQRPASAHSPYA